MNLLDLARESFALQAAYTEARAKASKLSLVGSTQIVMVVNEAVGNGQLIVVSSNGKVRPMRDREQPVGIALRKAQAGERTVVSLNGMWE